jgi:endonuclease III related protein
VSPPGTTAEQQIRAWFRALYGAWGQQHWWPAQSRWEVIVGAFLTQNTAWVNVEHAMRNLRRARALSLPAIRRMPLRELEKLVRPAGYFRQKAERLKNFVDYLDRRYDGSLDRMFARSTAELREELLQLNGIGPETADSILLYAGHHPSFVVDAYTRRVLHRHGVLPATADYEDIRALFEHALRDEPLPGFVFAIARAWEPHPPSRMSAAQRGAAAQNFNEMHGLIVNVGKYHCRKPFPLCEGCPLKPFLPAKGPVELEKKFHHKGHKGTRRKSLCRRLTLIRRSKPTTETRRRGEIRRNF